MRANLGNSVLVWTTYPADGDPGPLARTLVDERLAACVTVEPGLRSTYRWQSAVETADEYRLTLKTSEDRLDSLRQRLLEVHPYELPEFLVVPVHGSHAYTEWVRASTAKDEG